MQLRRLPTRTELRVEDKVELDEALSRAARLAAAKASTVSGPQGGLFSPSGPGGSVIATPVAVHPRSDKVRLLVVIYYWRVFGELLEDRKGKHSVWLTGRALFDAVRCAGHSHVAVGRAWVV